MKHRTLTLRLAAFILAALLPAGALAGCSGGAQSSSADLDDELAYATARVYDFSHFGTRNFALFSDRVFAKANAAAMMLSGDVTDEELEKIARCLYLDSVTVADDSRTVIASYPDDDEGRSLKEIDGKNEFMGVVKNNVTKQMSDPAPAAESGLYSVMAGVKRTDGTGAVIIALTTDEYADVSGENLAEKCGCNTVILKDGAVLSSTLNGVSAGDTADELGVTEADLAAGEFTLTADSVSCRCKAADVERYTVICAEPDNN